MKFKEVTQFITDKSRKLGFTIKKHSPEILMYVGITGIVVGGVCACVETLKAPAIAEEHKKQINDIREKAQEEENLENSEYSESKEIVKIYLKTSGKYIKLYLPAVIIESLSITAVVGSNKILKQRSAAVLTAYIGTKAKLDELTDRLKHRLSPEEFDEVVNGVTTEEVVEVTTDENGNEVEVTKKNLIVTDTPVSYTYYIGSSSTYWEPSAGVEYMCMVVNAAMAQFNNKIKYHEPYIVFLNDILKDIGLPISKEGQVAGFRHNPDLPLGVNDIRYEIRRVFIDNEEVCALTLLNVMPDVYSDFPEVKKEYDKIES